tara:strand:+ start:1234 stop:2265 length:1032 start_codon:yes stop_codon:yes gene_type:complete
LFEDLSVRHPIVQAPMAGVTTPALAAAVSEAGALGSLGLGAASPDKAREEIEGVRALTDRAFNVNFFCHAPPMSGADERRAWLAHLAPYFQAQGAVVPDDLANIYQPINDNPAMQEVIFQTRPPVVSFHFGVPSAALIDGIHDYGGQVWICVTTPTEAEQAVAAGASALIAQGVEAGGHRGNFAAEHDAEFGLVALLRILVRRHSVPIIAAGGLMDGTAIHGVLSMGAAAAQLGTAFVACPESAAAPAYRDALRLGQATEITQAISGRPARGLVGPFQSDIAPGAPWVPDYPLAYDAAKQLHAAAKANNDHRYAPNWAGQGVALSREMPGAELVAVLVEEMKT